MMLFSCIINENQLFLLHFSLFVCPYPVIARTTDWIKLKFHTVISHDTAQPNKQYGVYSIHNFA